MEIRRREKSSQSLINQKPTLKNHFHTVYFTGLNCFFFIFPKRDLPCFPKPVSFSCWDHSNLYLPLSLFGCVCNHQINLTSFQRTKLVNSEAEDVVIARKAAS